MMKEANIQPEEIVEEQPKTGFLDKIKTHKLKILIGILGFLVFAGAVFGAYKLGQRQIQLASQPSPTPEAVATPTPDPTVDWITHINSKYRYSIRYPSGLRLFEIGEITGASSSEWQATGIKIGSLEVQILGYENKDNLSSKEYAEKNAPKLPLSNQKAITIDGRSAYQHDHTDIRGDKELPVRRTTVAFNGFIIEIIGINLSEQEEFISYDLILSTLRFLEEEAETGTVTGRLCYPSEFLPKGRILAKNLTSGKVYAQEYPGSSAGGISSYSFELPSEEYILKYLTRETGTSGYSGYYSTCSKYLDIGDCEDYESWEPLPVEVTAGQTTEGIDLCDFYYVIPEREPEF